MSSVDATLFDLNLLRQELIRDEGLRLEAYKDSLGYWTIGVGHLLKSPPPHEAWTREKCLEVLDQDIQEALARTQHIPCWASLDTDGRRRALLNMRFQLGGKLETFFKSLRYILNKQWREAGQELRQSAWYNQTTVRAERVIRMIENG